MSTTRAKKATNKSKRKPVSAASKKVAEVMHEFKRGTLRSGGSKQRVTNPRQAIAIGLSEARVAARRPVPTP